MIKAEEKKVFIISCMYFVILLAVAFVISKYDLPMVTPFVAALVIAYLPKGPICFLLGGLHLNQKVTAILLVLLSYSTTGPLIALLCTKMLSQGRALIANLPAIYTNRAELALAGVFSSIKQFTLYMGPSLVGALEELEGHFVQSADQMVSGLSIGAMGWVSGFASSLPGPFISLLPMVIAIFFTAMDCDRLTSSCLLQVEEKPRGIFLRVQAYMVGMLFVCVRSYVFITSITFVEPTPGLILIGAEHSLLIALLIAVFDILPALGTGGIMILWMIITATTGDRRLTLRLLIVYLTITVIRNTIESRIVGSQIGLHPVVMLVSMFVGAQPFGVSGLFGFPIGLSLLCHPNDTSAVRLFRAV